MSEDELRPKDIEFYASQTLKHWEEVEGGNHLRYQEEDTGSYISLDLDEKTIDGKLQGALGEAGEELNTLVETLEEEGYERDYVDNEADEVTS